ncbi:MAG: redoxin family protein, partial [Lentisphaeria bacterium]|nr:redoxin family protein [Lentisphaeria bacterium]
MKTRIVFSIITFFCAVQLSADEHWFSKSFSEKLVYKDGRVTNTAKILNGKTVAVYFSASWCGPCRLFTPKLVDFYNSCAGKKNIEVVFASSDRTPDAMRQYMQKANMPWSAIPFDAQKLAQLRRKFRVNGIPRLIVF